VTVDDKLRLMRRHLALNLDFYGARFGLVLFRKHAARYLNHLPGYEALRLPLLTAASVAEFDDLLERARSQAVAAQPAFAPSLV